MHSRIASIEQDFRDAWKSFNPAGYDEYLNQVDKEQRGELLVRLLSAELEYHYQPPSRILGTKLASVATAGGGADSDDERIQPCVQLFWLRFSEIQNDENLLIRLVVLEFALRIHHDRVPPEPESYLALCDASAHPRLLKLLEMTESRLPNAAVDQVKPEVQHSDSTVKDEQLPSQKAPEPLPAHFGQFLLVRHIGRGGMGFVYAAVDLNSTARVAIKVMRRVDAWSVFRFFEEFRWLSQLEHPNLVKLYNAYTEDDCRYFSMELVEGHTIGKWFRGLSSNSEVRWTLLRRVFSQIVSAINYLHENDILHCDIKCSNMMITHKMRAVVLDLGLAIRQGQSNPLVGTVQYMAPEVLNKGQHTTASDWYSFGVMMYEVMTGKYPAIDVQTRDDGSADYDVNSAQLLEDIANCPEDLRQLCLSLMSVDPEERPSAKRIMALMGDPEVVPLNNRATIEGCPGREKELRLLNQALLNASAGDRRCVVVHGESGIGKSSLLDHWQKTIDSAEYTVLNLTCYQQDHTPNRLMNALIQELLNVLPSVPAQFWQPSLEKHINQIGSLFPQLNQLLADDSPRKTTSLPPAARKECFRAVVDWLVSISENRQLVFTIDDAQWADGDSMLALMSMNRRVNFRGLVVLANDSVDPLLRVLRTAPAVIGQEPVPIEQDSVSIPVLPLGRKACIELIDQWAAQANVEVDPVACERLVRLSGGNPFLLREMVRTFVSDFEEHSEDAVSLISNADANNTVRRRFAGLPQNAELTLEFLAVANHSLSFLQLQMLTNVMPQDLLRTLGMLRSQGWIRSRIGGADSEVEISHERFRRAILQGFESDRLQRRHARIARILSHESPAPWSRVAGHYWAANRIPEAAACYMESARDAYKAGAIEEAFFFIDRASHPSAVRTPEEKQELLRIQADCLACNGSTRAAAEAYEHLAAASQGDQSRLLRCLAGEQWLRGGQPQSGVALLRDTLSRLGIRQPTNSLVTSIRTVIDALRISHQSNNDRFFNEESSFSEIEACLNRVASPLTYLENGIGQKLVIRMMRMACERGSLQDRSQAILRTGVILSFAGQRLRSQAIRRFHLGRTLAHESGLDSALAIWNFCMFIWYIQKGHNGRAMKHGERGIERFDRTRERFQWEQQFLRWGILCTYYHNNQLRQLREATVSQRESALRRDDPMSMFWTHVAPAHWSDLAADDVQAARQSLLIAERSVASNTYQLPRLFLWLSQTHQQLYEGNSEEAQRTLHGDWKQLFRSITLRTNHYKWFALHTRVCCDLMSAYNNPADRAKWLRDATATTRKMLRLQEPAFVSYGRGLQLVINASNGRIASRNKWQYEIETLRRYDHSLVALALQWHFWLYHEHSEEQIATVRKQLTDQGCVNPNRLMNLVIPLPPAAR